MLKKITNMAFPAAQLQKQIKENSNDLTDFLKDLNRWEDSIKNEDQNLKTSRNLEDQLPPVRSKVKKPKDSSKPAKKSTEETEKTCTKKDRIKSYDYDAWSKFDVEAACRDSTDESSNEDEEEEERDEEEEEKIRESKKVQQASMEKEKGNQLFKEGKYEAAINRYTNAIMLHSNNPILYANRGMALMKVERYGAAEQDCTTALQFDPMYTKALARRASSREKLEKYESALQDYQQLLELEPKNKQALTEIEKIKKVLEKKKSGRNEKNHELQKTSTTLIEKNTVNKETRRRRSNKPLKRIHIEEIGIEDAEESKTNEKKKNPVNSRVPELANFDSIVVPTVSSVSVPTTSFMFETEYKRLGNNQEQLYKYNKMIPTSSYAKLFHQCIDNLLSPFLSILHNCYIRDNLPYHEELSSISLVKRFDMAALFLSKSDKEVLTSLFRHLSSKEYNVSLDANFVKELTKKFSVSL